MYVCLCVSACVCMCVCVRVCVCNGLSCPCSISLMSIITTHLLAEAVSEDVKESVVYKKIRVVNIIGVIEGQGSIGWFLGLIKVILRLLEVWAILVLVICSFDPKSHCMIFTLNWKRDLSSLTLNCTICHTGMNILCKLNVKEMSPRSIFWIILTADISIFFVFFVFFFFKIISIYNIHADVSTWT